ncbi:MAG TPA: hypothetical protein ENN51_05040 [candidate division WOR-3 bacterium]|uniref:Uncharacterized protein n=1 Tax=candidate division WOR-3 bacterium TaxID=2052148 RepID=A0A7V0XFA9_UNCW3|nr:hypothetical protein [candidate division WOR-3 bacterium]
MAGEEFATAINCMDGRTQLPVIEWMRRECGVEYVDNVTEPGPVKTLAEEPECPTCAAVHRRVEISCGRHGSHHIAVVAHENCAGNPVSKEVQLEQLRRAVATVAGWKFDAEVIGLWLGSDWRVEKIV